MSTTATKGTHPSTAPSIKPAGGTTPRGHRDETRAPVQPVHHRPYNQDVGRLLDTPTGEKGLRGHNTSLSPRDDQPCTAGGQCQRGIVTRLCHSSGHVLSAARPEPTTPRMPSVRSTRQYPFNQGDVPAADRIVNEQRVPEEPAPYITGPARRPRALLSAHC